MHAYKHVKIFRSHESVGLERLELPAARYPAMGDSGTYSQQKSNFPFTAFRRNFTLNAF